MDLNSASGSKHGISPDKIDALPHFRESGLFDPAEKLALELASRMIAVPVQVPDALFAELQKHYSDAALVEMAATIAFENFRSRFNRVFQIEAHGFYCPVPLGSPGSAS